MPKSGKLITTGTMSTSVLKALTSGLTVVSTRWNYQGLIMFKVYGNLDNKLQFIQCFIADRHSKIVDDTTEQGTTGLCTLALWMS